MLVWVAGEGLCGLWCAHVTGGCVGSTGGADGIADCDMLIPHLSYLVTADGVVGNSGKAGFGHACLLCMHISRMAVF